MIIERKLCPGVGEDLQASWAMSLGGHEFVGFCPLCGRVLHVFTDVVVSIYSPAPPTPRHRPNRPERPRSTGLHGRRRRKHHERVAEIQRLLDAVDGEDPAA